MDLWRGEPGQNQGKGGLLGGRGRALAINDSKSVPYLVPICPNSTGGPRVLDPRSEVRHSHVGWPHPPHVRAIGRPARPLGRIRGSSHRTTPLVRCRGVAGNCGEHALQLCGSQRCASLHWACWGTSAAAGPAGRRRRVASTPAATSRGIAGQRRRGYRASFRRWVDRERSTGVWVPSLFFRPDLLGKMLKPWGAAGM